MLFFLCYSVYAAEFMDFIAKTNKRIMAEGGAKCDCYWYTLYLYEYAEFIYCKYLICFHWLDDELFTR